MTEVIIARRPRKASNGDKETRPPTPTEYSVACFSVLDTNNWPKQVQSASTSFIASKRRSSGRNGLADFNKTFKNP